MFEKLLQSVTRKKVIGADDLYSTKLNRCLSTFDLALLGMGQMIGAGIYVLTGAFPALNIQDFMYFRCY